MGRRFELVDTYERLGFYRRLFMADHDAIELVVIGRPGVGKTKAFTGTLGEPGTHYTLIRGNVTAFELYRKLYVGRDLPVLLDDIDDALTDPKKKSLLKEALESEEIKTVSWGSATSLLVDEDKKPIPKRFKTRSRFCIIGNKLTDRTEEHLSAILSRAFCVEFRPTNPEVHTYVGQWFTDSEIHQFVGDHLSLIPELDIRDYMHALKLKAHDENWRQMLVERWIEDERLVPVLRIINDPTLTNSKDRVERYRTLTGGSRRTFMYHQARIRAICGPESRQVTQAAVAV